MSQNEDERSSFEQNLFKLLGKEVRVIKYIEAPPLDDLIGWAQFKDKFHGVQQGVQLTYSGLSGLQDAFVHWNGFFQQYGLAFEERPWTDFVINGAVWDVTAQKPWTNFLPATVTELSVFWHPSELSEPAPWPRPLYPRDLELTFANQFKIYMSAAHFDSENEKLIFGDHNVVVAWSADFAEKHKLCGFADFAQTASRHVDSVGRLVKQEKD